MDRLARVFVCSRFFALGQYDYGQNTQNSYNSYGYNSYSDSGIDEKSQNARPTDYFYQTKVPDEIQDESTNDYSAFDCS